MKNYIIDNSSDNYNLLADISSIIDKMILSIEQNTLEMNIVKKKTIHFILPGGGVRGSFQAGFLWCLRNHYQHLFNIYRIDGTSVGALNGFAFILHDSEQIKNLWFNINSIDDIFNSYSDKPIWGKIKSIYNGFFEKSICTNQGLKNIINNNIDNINSDLLELYYCVVTDIYQGKYEYINGLNKDIIEYIIASASPWIIAPPVSIDNHIYIDGGLLQTYPIENIKISNADIKVIVGTDKMHSNKLGMPGTNIFHYLIRLIDICRFNSSNINKLEKYITKYNMVSIENPLECPFLEFTPEHVLDGFNQGIVSAHKFADQYLL